MTDNESIKALEENKNNDEFGEFTKRYISNVLDLINRQKAENVELVEENQKLHKICDKAIKSYKETKSEAIKEFWRKAKEKGTTAYYDYQQRPCVWVEDGDNLVKEMVGE